MEFPPEPQEFEWYEMQGKHGFWRMGERVEFVADSSGQMIRLIGFGLPALFYLLTVYGGWRQWSEGQLGAGVLTAKLVVWTGIEIAAIAICLWYFAGLKVIIDWGKGVVITKRAFITRKYALSSVKSVVLANGYSNLINTSLLRLVVDQASIPLLETHHDDNAESRDAKLATLGRRLAATLKVPFQTLRKEQQVLASGMSDVELAEKYTKEGERLALHGDHAEMKGIVTEAKAYRDQAEYHFKYALELDPDHAQALIGIGRISGSHDLRLQAADLAVDVAAGNVDVLLERAHARYLAGDEASSLADYNQAVDLERSVKTLRDRGTMLWFQNRYEDALSDFEAAIEMEPTNAELHYWRSECWRRIFGDYPEDGRNGRWLWQML